MKIHYGSEFCELRKSQKLTCGFKASHRDTEMRDFVTFKSFGLLEQENS